RFCLLYGHWVELRWSGVLLGLDPEGGAGRSSGADVRLCRLESERGVGVQEIAHRPQLESLQGGVGLWADLDNARALPAIAAKLRTGGHLQGGGLGGKGIHSRFRAGGL